ncbi:hypothetical protein BHE90_014086 [Fusarium euwallaceae]|uniref:Uncharacterized protein n=1 Tax=Fusarium euwallaceae TaxID=1147111 RepID=A0A430L731_9HYPO|nr:hypothetical protein BHE90_014086 [Fusarium euwallaceae]
MGNIGVAVDSSGCDPLSAHPLNKHPGPLERVSNLWKASISSPRPIDSSVCRPPCLDRWAAVT